jgi:hypothetical protein
MKFLCIRRAGRTRARTTRRSIQRRLQMCAGVFFTALLVGTFTGAATNTAYAAAFTYGAGPTGVYSVSCSGPGDGGLANLNFDNQLFFKAGAQCQANVDTAGPSYAASAASAFTASGVTSSAMGQSTMGVLKASAKLNTGPSTSVPFPAGFAETGFADVITVNAPGQTGQIAVVDIVLNLTGVLTATGPNSFSRVQLYVDADNGVTAPHVPGYQVQAGVNPSPTVINEVVMLSVGFIVGDPDEFVVKLMAQAMTSSQTSFGENAAEADFFNTLTWGGIAGVTIGGNAIDDFTIDSASGVDWTVAASSVISAPPAWAVLGIAVLGLARVRRR